VPDRLAPRASSRFLVPAASLLSLLAADPTRGGDLAGGSFTDIVRADASRPVVSTLLGLQPERTGDDHADLAADRLATAPDDLESLDDQPTTTPAFGAADSWRWGIYGAAAADIAEDGEQYGVLWFASWFPVENVSLNFEFGGWFFDEPFDAKGDTGGANANLLLRWHFLAEDRWSIYVDGGAGLLVAGEEVPRGGTNFNFTPQAGIGGTIALDDAGRTRLMVGARWHHVSNARIKGAEANPGRDSVLGYVGVTIPF